MQRLNFMPKSSKQSLATAPIESAEDTAIRTATELRVSLLVAAWMAVTALILSTACTGGGGGRPNQPQKPALNATGATPSPLNWKGEVDKSSSTSSQEAPSAPQGLTPSSKGVPKRKDHVNSVTYDPRDLGSTEPMPVTPPLERAGDLVYTGASKDQVREQVQHLVDEENAEGYAESNNAFAAEVNQSQLEYDPVTNVATFRFIRTETDGRNFQVSMTGQRDGYGRIAMGQPGIAPYFSAIAECLDTDGYCRNVHVKIMDSGVSPARIAHVIIRDTPATLYTTGQTFGVAHNPDYDAFLHILLNTVTGTDRTDIVYKLDLQTSETINGASNFMVPISMYIEGPIPYQDLVFTGELVRDKNSDNGGGNLLNVLSNGPMGQTIDSARLVRNDGQGTVQLSITVRARVAGSVPDTVTLTVGRIPNPCRPPSVL